jgi:hypothetical protein
MLHRRSAIYIESATHVEQCPEVRTVRKTSTLLCCYSGSDGFTTDLAFDRIVAKTLNRVTTQLPTSVRKVRVARTSSLYKVTCRGRQKNYCCLCK